MNAMSQKLKKLSCKGKWPGEANGAELQSKKAVKTNHRLLYTAKTVTKKFELRRSLKLQTHKNPLQLK